ncbi:MAG: META domain-containing protein [bacterium]
MGFLHWAAITSLALAPAPSWDELAGYTYEGIHVRPVQLTRGRWDGTPFAAGGSSRPSLELFDPVLATGDLDADRSGDAVVLLMQSSGGSGLFYHLAVVGRDGPALRQLGVAPLGDRVQIRSVAVDGDRIRLDVVQAGPEDAMCCPSEKAELVWELSDRGLAQISSETTGRLSLADLEGTEWVLERFGWSEPAPRDPEATLVVEGGRVSGSSFCNRYFGGVVESSPGQIVVGGVGSTRMSCPAPADSLELRFQGALAAAVKYSFLCGKLALTVERDGILETLVFAPRP